MNLVFPFKNISTNTLLDFVEKKSKIKDFILTEKDEYPYAENYFLNEVERYKNTLPDFENEILQIINTTSQQTIDYFFSELQGNLEYLRDETTLESIRAKVDEWNEKAMDSFNEKVEKETENYFKNEDRKRAHLEEYEETIFSGYGISALYSLGSSPTKKVKKTNYNFYCVESQPDLIDIEYVDKFHAFIKELKIPYHDVVKRYFIPHSEGKIKSKLGEVIFSKPVVFVEGEHDITYIIKAAELLNKKEVLEKIELRQRGGWSNLDKIWNIYKDNNWETIPQKKLLLYDCDTQKKNEETGDIFKRIIETVPGNIISKGIENLFPNTLIERAKKEKLAFIDVTHIHRTKRGVVTEEIIQIVNEDEKKNLCDWICENGTKDDFESFNAVFDLINLVL